MLRPLVAVTNCANAGLTSGLVIGRQRLSLKKAPDTVNLRVTGPTRCPGGARSSTRWGGRRDRRAATRRRPPGITRRRPVYAALQGRARQRVSLAGMSLNRRETWFFANISKALRGHYDEGAPNTYREDIHSSNWLASSGSITSCRTRRRRQQ